MLFSALDDPGPIDPPGPVIIIRSGLSLLDRVVGLLKAGRRGEILAVSRRGLLPRTHAPTSPLSIGLADIPLGQR
jgi:uncharacterized NAD(P)/FAD-binding protein YdhS